MKRGKSCLFFEEKTMRKNYHLLVFMILLVQGCQEPTTSNIDNEILVIEMTSDLQSGEFQRENDWLLSQEEAKQALLEMIAKKEARSNALSRNNKEENEAKLKIIEEKKRKEKELLETAEPGEDLKQSLQKLRDETNEQMRKTVSHYGGKYASVINTDWGYKEDEIWDYGEFFQDYVVIVIPTPTDYPLPDGDWECDLKNGFFRRFERHLHGDKVAYGRFKKDENDQWKAVETGWGLAVYDYDNETWEPYNPGPYDLE